MHGSGDAGTGESFEAALHFIGGAEHELIAGLGLGRIDRVGGQRQDAGGLGAQWGDAKCRERLDQVGNPAILVQIDEIERGADA